MSNTLIWAAVVALFIICMTVVLTIAVIKAPSGASKKTTDLHYDPDETERGTGGHGSRGA